MSDSSDNKNYISDIQTTLNLNDKILSLSIVRCKICQEIPNPPIMTHEYGNLCGCCYNANNHPDASRNSTLEEILKQMKLPCPFEKNGCKQILKYENLTEHKNMCICRNYICPVSTCGNCNWNGNFTNLQEHFEAYHINLILRQNPANNFITVIIDINQSNKSISLLKINDEIFLLQIVCNIEFKKILLIVYYIGNDYKASNYYYILEPSVEEGNCCLKLEGKCEMFSNFEIINKDIMINDVNSVFDIMQVNLSKIEENMQNGKVSTKLLVKNERAAKLDYKLLACVACDFCKNYMKPPIFLCCFGHNLCNECKRKGAQCPVCNYSLGNNRNYAIESVSKIIYYPCTYRNFGCKEVCTGEYMMLHELACPLQTFNCPVNDKNKCTWKGTSTALILHLKSNHKEMIRFTDQVQVTGFDKESYDMFFMIAMDETFCVHYKHDLQNYFWAVQTIKLSEKTGWYKYEIDLVDTANDFKVVLQSTCQCLNQEIQFISLKKQYFCNEKLAYYVKIYRTK